MAARCTPLLFFLLLAATLTAQIPEPTPSYAGCSITRESWALTNPNLHCVCHSESQLPDCGSGTASSSTTPALTTKQTIQLDIASSVVDAFVNMLFSDNSQANAQKQQMLKELQMKQAMAVAQQQREEAIRLAAICRQLQSTLKLSGTPQLQMKLSDSGSNTLGLKLGDENQPPSTAPTNTRVLSPVQSPSDGGLELKLGDDAPPPPPTPQTASSDQLTTVPDLSSMTPKQLADLVASLPPEQQQRIIEAAQGHNPHLVPGTKYEAAPVTTTDAIQANSNANTATPAQTQSSGALGQLQQTAATSQAATHAGSPEEMRAQAGKGFDTAGGATGLPSTGSNSSSAPVAAQPASSAVVDLSHHSGNPSSLPAVDMNVLAPPPSLKPATASPAAQPNTATQPASKAKDCIPPTKDRLPTRDQLLTELSQRRTDLENLQNVVSRLNRNIQSDQKLFDEWQGEAEAGYDRTVDRLLSLPTKLALDSLLEMKEEDYTQLKNSVIFDEAAHDFHIRGLTPTEEQQVRWLERAKDLKTFDDFQKLVLDEKTHGEAFEEGARQLISILTQKYPEIGSYANAAEDLIDNMYDYVDLKNSWDIINTLDHNSDRYLLAVKSNGDRIRALVTRINQIQAQLNAVLPTTQLPYCNAH
jgi:hypothetical protein